MKIILIIALLFLYQKIEPTELKELSSQKKSLVKLKDVKMRWDENFLQLTFKFSDKVINFLTQDYINMNIGEYHIRYVKGVLFIIAPNELKKIKLKYPILNKINQWSIDKNILFIEIPRLLPIQEKDKKL